MAGKMYVERFRFTPPVLTGLVATFALAGVTVFIVLAPDLLTSVLDWVAAAIVAVLVTTAVSVLVTTLRRPVALRLDAGGVTLGHSPFPHRTDPVTVPWPDIEAIVLSSTAVRGGEVGYIGLRLRPGANPPDEAAGLLNELTAVFGPDSPEDVTLYRYISGWRVDERKLRRVARNHARDIKITNG